MRHLRTMVLAIAAMALMGTIARAGETSKLMTDVAAKAGRSVALLSYMVEVDGAQKPMPGGGQAICIDGSGIFMTASLDPQTPKEMYRDITLTLPGADAKTVKAKLLGIDMSTGMGFVQPEEKIDVQAVEFVDEPLHVGDPVVSVGILPRDGNRTVYYGVAYVSAILRVPGPMAFVVGGRLTGVCSPVFNAEGKAVGMVGRQLPIMYSTSIQNQPLRLAMTADEETNFFVPSSEFLKSLQKDRLPRDGEIRRLPWIGATFTAVNPENAKLRGVELPAVMATQVIKNQPAEAAGMKESDIVVAIDGKPLEKMANADYVDQNFMRELLSHQVGEKLRLTVVSGNERKDLTITVSAMPTLPTEAKRYYDPAAGLMVRDQVDLDHYLGQGAIATEVGLVVLGVAQNGPAQAEGIQANDLLTHFDGQPVKTVDAYKVFAEAAAKKGASFTLTFNHEKQPVTKTFKQPVKR